MESNKERAMRLLNLRDDWQLAVAACMWYGETDSVKIRWIHTALVRGAMPEIVRKFCDNAGGLK